VKSTIDDVGVRTSLEYPHASGESYRTLSGAYDDLQRLTGITESGNTIADYDYKGLYLQDRGIGNSAGSRIVKLTFKDSTDLDGYDYWGRIETMRHYKVSDSSDVATFEYGYDYGSNRTYQEDQVDTSEMDELYAYDTLHRLTSFERGDLRVEETQEYGAAADRTLTTTFDLAGRLKTLAYPGDGTISAMTLTYTHDDVGRITAVNDGAADRVEDTWKGYLLQKREYASDAYLTYLDDQGGNLSGYGYDAFGQVKTHRWKSSGATLLAGWAHERDRLGNKNYQEDLQSATESELYAYDDVYRVTSMKRGQLNGNKDDITSPTRTQTWTLDDLGNWSATVIDATTENRTHNDVNELTDRDIGETEIDLTYDEAGNLAQDGAADGDHKYYYDYRNRLIEVEEYQTDTWNDTAEYKYDGLGRRVLKIVTNKGSLNGTTRYFWGGSGNWQCLEELASDDDILARFTYSPGYIDAVAVQERDLNTDGDFGDTDEVVYYHCNTIFSVYALTDANETVIERYEYDAYGSATVLDADGSSDADGLSDVENPYLFQGRRLDLETGLMQYRFRDYSPTLGRFLQRDPIGYPGGMNVYQYARLTPSMRLDPGGLKDYKIGSGPDPDIEWDDEYVHDPNAEPTWRDRWNWCKYGTLLVGAEALEHLPDGSRPYRHYRTAKGTDLLIDYDEAIRDDDRIRNGFDAELAGAEADIEREHDGKTTQFSVYSTSARLVNSSTENWEKAIGGHRIWGTGDVTYDPDTCEYTLTISVDIEDFYNFNKGSSDKATGLPDDENGRFAVFGWAKAFYSRGTVTRTVKWKRGKPDTTTQVDGEPRRGRRRRTRRERR